MHFPDWVIYPSGLQGLELLILWPTMHNLFLVLFPSPHVAEQVPHASQAIQLTVSKREKKCFEIYQSMIVTFVLYVSHPVIC